MTAARRGFAEWRAVLPLERARILRRLAELLRQHAGELALIDAANCGNPVREMEGDALVAAAQIDFFAGLVTEMKGASIPMGPDVVNFSVREPVGVVARIVPVQSSIHVRRRQIGSAARRRQRGRREAAGPGAAVRAAPRGAGRRTAAAGRVQRRAGRSRHRRDAGVAQGRRDGRDHRQRRGRARGDARGERHGQAGAARARRQERADRLSRRRSGRASRRRWSAG